MRGSKGRSPDGPQLPRRSRENPAHGRGLLAPMTGVFLVWIERRFQRGPFLFDAVGVVTHQPGPSALFAEGYLCVLAVSPYV